MRNTQILVDLDDRVTTQVRNLYEVARRASVRMRQSLEDHWSATCGIHCQNTNTMMEILDMAKKHEDEKRKGRTDPVIVQGHDVPTTPGPVASPSNMMEGPMAEGLKGWSTRARPNLKNWKR